MLGRLFLLFTIVTLLELAILIPISNAMGFLFTLALVIATGVLGAYLAKKEGLRILSKINEKLAKGGMPSDELVDGLFVLVAGAFLLTPGVLTDVVGFLFLIPPARAPLKAMLKKRFKRALEDGTVNVAGARGPGGVFFSSFGGGQSPFGSSQSPFGGAQSPFSSSSTRDPFNSAGPARLKDAIDRSHDYVYQDGDVIDVTPATEQDQG